MEQAHFVPPDAPAGDEVEEIEEDEDDDPTASGSDNWE
jgi:hypothetical protein